MTGEEVVEILEKTGTKEWQEAISSRLESLRSYFGQDEWAKGISPWIRAVMGHGISKILGETLDQNAYQYTRGFIAGLRLVLTLPTSIDGQIQAADAKQKAGKPDEKSGY